MRYLEYLKRFTYTPNEFYDHLMGLEDAASGNVDVAILPAMTGEASNEEALSPTVSEVNAEGGMIIPVEVRIVNKDEETLTFYNGVLEVDVAISTTLGTIAINDGDQGAANADGAINLVFENGAGKFIIVTGGTWAEDDTIKVTVDDNNAGIMSYTVEKNNHFLAKVAADPEE